MISPTSLWKPTLTNSYIAAPDIPSAMTTRGEMRERKEKIPTWSGYTVDVPQIRFTHIVKHVGHLAAVLLPNSVARLDRKRQQRQILKGSLKTEIFSRLFVGKDGSSLWIGFSVDPP